MIKSKIQNFNAFVVLVPFSGTLCAMKIKELLRNF